MFDNRIIAELLSKEIALRELGVTSLYAFGSRNRGDNRDESDLDLFVDYDRETGIPPIFKLISLELDLEARLGFPVHIATRNSLHPRMKSSIEAEASRIF